MTASHAAAFAASYAEVSPMTPRLEVVVARRIDRASTSLPQLLSDPTRFAPRTALPLGTDSVLRIDTPFSATGSRSAPRWTTTGRLYGRGPRVALFARVEVEVSAWSDRAGELRLRPVGQHVGLWGRRRQRRYFALAHRSADRMVQLLTAIAAGRDAADDEDDVTGRRCA
jgi:hypothetical protein